MNKKKKQENKSFFTASLNALKEDACLTSKVSQVDNRPFSYSTKEPGSSDIFIHFDAQGSIEWRWSFDHHCAYSKIRQIVMKYRSIHILFQNS